MANIRLIGKHIAYLSPEADRVPVCPFSAYKPMRKRAYKEGSEDAKRRMADPV